VFCPYSVLDDRIFGVLAGARVEIFLDCCSHIQVDLSLLQLGFCALAFNGVCDPLAPGLGDGLLGGSERIRHGAIDIESYRQLDNAA